MDNALKILLIEDDPDDIELMQDALRSRSLDVHLDTIKQGDLVLPFLEKSDSHPNVIVLDLNLPKMHGREVLNTLKSSLKLKYIPVIILTTSSAKREMDYCLENGASEYLIKPVTMDGFSKVVNSIIRIARGEGFK